MTLQILSVMGWSARIKPLYLLAMFQLVAGPLVLFQVTVLCKVAVREVPKHGIASGVSMAWKSAEFQAVLAAADVPAQSKSKSALPTSDPQSDAAKVKMPVAAWRAVHFVVVNPPNRLSFQDIARMWTPALPLPPPGPPPRVG
ncbi:MAG: hypothetical protein H7Y36_05620 [Armatimonadetes bacterium]|nr:hypothetical protein [Akkermansiaceae bacterium]